MIEYADMECPACASFAREIKPGLIRQYIDSGKVKLVFKHFPLSSHPRARDAAQATFCAFQQGKFWQMHDRLFGSMKVAEGDLQAASIEVGLDQAAYRSCRARPEAGETVDADKAGGEALHIKATPTFYFGKIAADGRVRVSHAIVGAKSIGGFTAILDGLIK